MVVMASVNCLIACCVCCAAGAADTSRQWPCCWPCCWLATDYPCGEQEVSWPGGEARVCGCCGLAGLEAGDYNAGSGVACSTHSPRRCALASARGTHQGSALAVRVSEHQGSALAVRVSERVCWCLPPVVQSVQASVSVGQRHLCEMPTAPSRVWGGWLLLARISAPTTHSHCDARKSVRMEIYTSCDTLCAPVF